MNEELIRILTSIEESLRDIADCQKAMLKLYTEPEEPKEEPAAPIPYGVVYSPSSKMFLDERTGMPMSRKFRETWISRCDEFPRKVHR